MRNKLYGLFLGILFLGLGWLTIYLCHSHAETALEIFLLSYFVFLIYAASLFLPQWLTRVLALLAACHIAIVSLILKSNGILLAELPLLMMFVFLEWESRNKRLKIISVQARVEDLEAECNELMDSYENLKQKKKALKQKRERFLYLREAIRSISFSSPLEEISQQVASQAGALLEKDEAVMLFLLQEDKKHFELVAQSNLYRANVFPSEWIEPFHKWVLWHRQPLMIEETSREFRIEIPVSFLKDPHFPQSVIAIPLITEDKIVGILTAFSQRRKAFSVEELRLMAILASSAALCFANASLYHKTEQLANRDGLTQLFVPRYFLAQFKKILYERNEFSHSILMMDVDYFKKVNDTYGHLVGDTLLVHLSQVLSKYAPQASVLSRYGGEEFVLLLPNYTKKEAQQLAETIRKEVGQSKVTLRRQEFGVTLSIGVASFPEDGFIEKEILQKADEALYEAKRKGRDQVRCA